MNIAICSPITINVFSSYLDKEDSSLAEKIDDVHAPAVTNLALALIQKGQNLVIFTQTSQVKEVTILSGERIRIYIAPYPSRALKLLTPFYSQVLNLKRLFRLYPGKIDIVSAHWTRDYAIASLYFVKKGIPVFVTVRDILPYIVKQRRVIRHLKSEYIWIVYYLMNEYVMRNRKFQFVANSEYTAKMVEKYWHRSTSVIPNSIDGKDLPVATQNIKSKNEDYIITSISISSIEDKRKNILTLLKAFKIFRSHYPSSQLQLIGRGFTNEYGTINYLESKDLMGGVKLLGPQSHKSIMDYLAQSDLMVHPSLEETFGNTLIEAMLCECPVIAGEYSGAVPWVLDYGDAGFLTDVRDEMKLAETMEYVRTHPKEVSEKVVKGKNRSEGYFSSSNVADMYIELFCRELNK